jgi:hypothetical protein
MVTKSIVVAFVIGMNMRKKRIADTRIDSFRIVLTSYYLFEFRRDKKIVAVPALQSREKSANLYALGVFIACLAFGRMLFSGRGYITALHSASPFIAVR